MRFPTSSSLGSLSARYESNGNPATVSTGKGDIGGVSYGSYQLSTASGHAQKFANWFGQGLDKLKAGTSSFTNKWKELAKKDPEGFQQAQHAYIAENHYKPAVNALKSSTGVDVNQYSDVLKDVVWSIGVQHGAGGSKSIFSRSGIKPGMSERDIINLLYKERSKVNVYFKSSPRSTKDSVAKRFEKERLDALKRLG